NGPATVQALLAGQLDVAHLGIGPAMVARGKGADIKVVAASIKEQISFIALAPLAKAFEGGAAADVFKRFEAANGRKAVITTFPKGSVPEIVLQHWLRRVIKANSADAQIIYQGAAQVQQALLTGAVDAAAILEPIVTNVLAKVPGATVLAKGSGMFAGQPGAVMVVREKLIAEHFEVVEALVAAHKRATSMLNDDISKAMPHVRKYVGGGRLSAETVRVALESSQGSFVADPSKIIDGTRAMRDFQQELGSLKVKVDINQLFATQFYRAEK
ncbi:MAG: ABC transporter substrate-binding protein, partial [Proteobacteria bacterium]|nr:ABC transporter substrate-binding protein [Pseudomonadota bacterium]